MSDALDTPGAELPDDDPDVVAGMERLRILRQGEADIPDIVKPPS